jgi:hypothetical protein
LKQPFSVQDAEDMTTEKFGASFFMEKNDNGSGPPQSKVEFIKESIMRFQGVFDLDSSKKRWEVLAAFAVMLTDIYLCVSGRMKTLVYEYCLSDLFGKKVLVVQEGLQGEQVRVSKASCDTGEEKEGGDTSQLYTPSMDAELQSACHAVTNSWMLNLQQPQQQEGIDSGVVNASFSLSPISIQPEIRSDGVRRDEQPL